MVHLLNVIPIDELLHHCYVQPILIKTQSVTQLLNSKLLIGDHRDGGRPNTARRLGVYAEGPDIGCRTDGFGLSL